jgi:CcmD family protein
VTYLLAAYAVLLAAVLGYLVIHALKLARLDRELTELASRARERREEREAARVG